MRACARVGLIGLAAALLVPATASAGVGALDGTFNTVGTPPGTIVSSWPTPTKVNDVLVDSSGRTIVVGSMEVTGWQDAFIARYKVDGTLDTTFNGGGWYTFSVGAFDDVATAATLSLDGSTIIVAGVTTQGAEKAPFVANVNASSGGFGAPFSYLTYDPRVGFDDGVEDIAIDGSGRMVLVGASSTATAGTSDVLVGRLLPNGTPDFSFAANGFKFLDKVGDDVGHAVTVLPNNDIVFAGTANGGASSDFLVGRLLSSGAPDPAWGAGSGIVTTNVGAQDQAWSVAWHAASGTITVAGQSGQDTAITRYGSSGLPDPSWGGSGVVVRQLSPSSGIDGARTVLVENDGGTLQRVTIAGTADVAGGTAFLTARFHNDGTNDTIWNGTGSTTTQPGQPVSAAAAAFGPTSGRLLVAGSTVSDVALASYLTGNVAASLSVSMAGCPDANNAMVLAPLNMTPSGADCLVSVASNSTTGVRLMLAGTTLTGPITVPNYTSSWSVDAFGICMRELAGGFGTTGGWTTASGGVCAQTPASWWHGVPASPVVVATSTGASSGATAAFRFGVSDGSGAPLPAGNYNAQVTFTAVVNP